MKTVIFDGSYKNSNLLSSVIDIITDELTSKSVVEKIILHEKKIIPCTGCFHCWVKTPGTCIIDDFGRIAAKLSIQSDLMISVTPIVFGGYSSELKKALDRMIPTVLPFFKRVKGEIHHQLRYDKYPETLTIGVLQEPDSVAEKVFSELVHRNALNMHDITTDAVIINNLSIDFIRKKIRAALKNRGI